MKNFVVVTRPEPGLSETIDRINQLGFNALSMPLIAIEPLKIKFNINKPIGGIIFTSRQAIKPTIDVLCRNGIEYCNIPVYTVGKMTALDAKKGGFNKILNGNKDSETLLELIKNSFFSLDSILFYPTAKNKGKYLEQGLKKARIEVCRYEIYQTHAVHCLDKHFIDYLNHGTIDTILFFSLQSVKNFADLLPEKYVNDLRNVNAVGISYKLYSALKQFKWKRLVVSQQPNTDEMLFILKAFLKD
ncbi:hypothetical protein COMNV_00136 [Commensalibacter sp. Nvir]|uniref:uroporphyrinogen-III synthase n=1 Tax=Commensalibacter sp. Nvir TaxID=3069817 RepID=UPI002D3C88B6|nr:hypothetical protein COMNV_00136 [Commensalibacter sp. Nvir]